MNIQRGDVLKARFRHASGERSKKRPVVVVQADSSTPEAQAAVLTRAEIVSWIE